MPPGAAPGQNRGMEVQVRYFASAREATGMSQERVALDGSASVGDVMAELVRRHPALAAVASSLRFALAEEFVGPETSVPDGATLALIPPVGGG